MSESRDIVTSALERHFEPPRYEGDRVVVVVPDQTRAIDYHSMVGPLIERLTDACEHISILVGMGLHRAMHEAELAPLRDLARHPNVDLRQHDAHGESIATMATDVASDRPDWPSLPARVHRAVVDADHTITVGLVEPHQYAGFSGGAKGVAIGCGGASTIGAMHGLEFLRSSGTRLGAITSNPFQEALWRLVEPIDSLEGLQLVPSTDEAPLSATFGPARQAFESAVSRARERFFEEYHHPFGWLHLPVSGGKADNVYQASRAATYVALATQPAIATGGTILVEADSPEGLGTGQGERAFAEALRRARSTLLDELRGGTEIEMKGGQQRAYVLAMALERCSIALIGAPTIDLLESFGIEQFDTLEDARRHLDLEGRGRTIEDVFYHVPLLAPPDRESRES